MKVKELKDIIAYLETTDELQKTINTVVERALANGWTQDTIFKIKMPNGLTPYQEWKDKYSNYTNLIMNLRKYQKNKYEGMYYMSKHSIFAWRNK